MEQQLKSMASVSKPGIFQKSMERQPLDSESAELLREIHDPTLPHLADMTVVDARRRFASWSKPLLDPPVATVSGVAMETNKGSINARIYKPVDHGDQTLPLVIFFHAGGLVMGSLATHDSCCRLMANRSGCIFLSVDYSLAPEYKFPTAVEEAYEAVCWASTHASDLSVDPARIAVAGDSSGGVLATVACMLLRERGGAHIVKYQFLWYPSVGNVSDEPTALMKQLSSGYILDVKFKQWLLGHYLSASDSLANPLIQPIKCQDFTGMPPILVVSAGYDPGTEGHEAYCKMHAAANVDAEFCCAATTIHAFLMFLGKIPSATHAAEMSADLIREKLC